ncbi:MAG TPA: glutamate-5-semialdehyde dehydrogenase [Bacteroidales bacterium]|jgi:glutamate-5-semialdehyde dehydrogenase|nr:glutamate-5-semialdehyde dehydrogenase [Bacteroidales bacterium]
MILKKTLADAKAASRSLQALDQDTVSSVLLKISGEAMVRSGYILDENRKDLSLMEKDDPRYDRLMLTESRIKAISDDIASVARMKSPVGRILSRYIRPDGLKISRISVPFGVIGVIYESRPNVTFDVFSLCFKSGNAVILRGGKEAVNSNQAIVNLIKDVLEESGIDQDILTLITGSRNDTLKLLRARDFIDLIIPRGSRGLIDFVRKNSSIPVIETGAGICHTYFDEYGDRTIGQAIINNAKTRRVSVCNALDCLIIHEKRLDDLGFLVELCSASRVEIFADTKAFKALSGKYPPELLHKATKDSFGTEFLSYKMAVKTVSSFDEALAHIELYGSKHSEAVVTENSERRDLFFKMVDASSVYSNASTAFTDGGEFGLGAEIGISTQKLHARGPMALEELTTYKWIIEGNGQIRK